MNDLDVIADRLPKTPLAGFNVSGLTDSELNTLFAGDIAGSRSAVEFRVNQQVLDHYRSLIDQVSDGPLAEPEDYDYLCGLLAGRDDADMVAASWLVSGVVEAAAQLLSRDRVYDLAKENLVDLDAIFYPDAPVEAVEEAGEFLFDLFAAKLSEAFGCEVSDETLNLLVDDFTFSKRGGLEVVFATRPIDWLAAGSGAVEVRGGDIHVRGIDHMLYSAPGDRFTIGSGVKVRYLGIPDKAKACEVSAASDYVLAG